MNTIRSQFTLVRGFPADQAEQAARVYWDAFGEKIGSILGPSPRAIAFLAQSLNPSYAFSALSEDGRLLGVAGYRTQSGAFTNCSFRNLRAFYGLLGAVWRAPLMHLLDRPVMDKILLMDGICVVPEARGLGVGSALLNAIIAEAEQCGAQGVRLDVIDRNIRAKALYERMGFMTVKVEEMGMLSGLFGFEHVTEMRRPVEPSALVAPTPYEG